MFKVKFITNLDDVMTFEKFPKYLPALPPIDTIVQSARRWKGKEYQDERIVELKVTNIYLKSRILELGEVGGELDDGSDVVSWYEIYLDIPARWAHSGFFQLWYDFIRGKMTQSEYIDRQYKMRTK